MAQLAKDRRSSSCSFQGADGSTFSPLIHFQNLPSLSPSPGYFMFEDDEQYHHKQQLNNHSDNYTGAHGHEISSEGRQQRVQISNSPDLSSSSSADSSNEFAFHGGGPTYPHQLDDHHQTVADPSLIHFKPTEGNGSFVNGSGSSISFQQEAVDYGFVGPEKENYAWWESSIIDNYQDQHQVSKVLLKDGSIGSGMMYGDAAMGFDDFSAKETTNKEQPCFNKKRVIMEEDNIQTSKRQCTSSKKQVISKAKSSPPPTPPKDSQSAAAKNRRERISERLKILQDLVPNGSKVDMVTMLEKAIGYVKFLQLQVKVLAADEFWPAAGGKVPDISQVREALDAILQRDRSSTSQ